MPASIANELQIFLFTKCVSKSSEHEKIWTVGDGVFALNVKIFCHCPEILILSCVHGSLPLLPASLSHDLTPPSTCSMHLLSSPAIFLFCFTAWFTKRLGLLLVFRDCISLPLLLLFSGELNCFYTSDERFLQFLGQIRFPNIWSARKEAGECWTILCEKERTGV